MQKHCCDARHLGKACLPHVSANGARVAQSSTHNQFELCCEALPSLTTQPTLTNIQQRSNFNTSNSLQTVVKHLAKHLSILVNLRK